MPLLYLKCLSSRKTRSNENALWYIDTEGFARLRSRQPKAIYITKRTKCSARCQKFENKFLLLGWQYFLLSYFLLFLFYTVNITCINSDKRILNNVMKTTWSYNVHNIASLYKLTVWRESESGGHSPMSYVAY